MRGSSRRPRTRLIGAAKSVPSTGSQTTWTLNRASGTSASRSPSSEAPRTHTGHSGDSRTSTRTCSPAALKASRTSVREPGLRTARGGCPTGTRRGANHTQPYAATDTTTTAARSPRIVLNAFRILMRCLHSGARAGRSAGGGETEKQRGAHPPDEQGGEESDEEGAPAQLPDAREARAEADRRHGDRQAPGREDLAAVEKIGPLRLVED